MGTKNIAISEKAYRRLSALRMPNESFTEVIIRITKTGSYPELAGIQTPQEMNVLREKFAEVRNH